MWVRNGGETEIYRNKDATREKEREREREKGGRER